MSLAFSTSSATRKNIKWQDVGQFVRKVTDGGGFQTCLTTDVIFVILFGTASGAEITRFVFNGIKHI